MPIETKKTALKTSRNGRVALSIVSARLTCESIAPAINAPRATEKCSFWANTLIPSTMPHETIATTSRRPMRCKRSSNRGAASFPRKKTLTTKTPTKNVTCHT